MLLKFNFLSVIFLNILYETVYSQEGGEDGESFYSSRTAGAFSPLGVNFERTKIEHEADTSRSGVNTDSIIGPIMQPIAKAFNYMAENRRTIEYANQVEDEEKSKSMFDPKSILAALGREESRPAKAPSFMEQLFEPLVAPVKKELSKVKASTPANMFQDLFTTPSVPINSDGTRKAQPSPPAEAVKSPFEQTQLSSILTPLGVENNPETDEFQMGRDKTISIMGMPIGRRDGIALSPSKGLSYGNQNMLGPIAVNDKYNLQWDFLNKIQSMFIPASEGKPNFGNLIQLFTQRQ